MNDKELRSTLADLFDEAAWMATEMGYGDISNSIATESLIRFFTDRPNADDKILEGTPRTTLLSIAGQIIKDAGKQALVADQYQKFFKVIEAKAKGKKSKSSVKTQIIRDFMREIQALSPPEKHLVELQLKGSTVSQVIHSLGITGSKLQSLRQQLFARLGKALLPYLPSIPLSTTGRKDLPAKEMLERRFSLVFDADGNRDVIAEFLVEFATFYAELSGGDELVIRDGKIPSEVGVYA